MLGKYAARIRRLDRAARSAIIEDLEIPLPRRGLIAALEACRLCSADVVLILLRRGMLSQASMVAGVPVRRYIPSLPPWPPTPVARRVLRGDDRRVTRVTQPNPCKPGSGARDRYEMLYCGMVLRQAKARGVRQRDLLVWQRAGWIEVEGEAR